MNLQKLSHSNHSIILEYLNLNGATHGPYWLPRPLPAYRKTDHKTHKRKNNKTSYTRKK